MEEVGRMAVTLPASIRGCSTFSADDYREFLGDDPEFRRWLEEEYVPIFGGWQY
jgi:hypothetical protein